MLFSVATVAISALVAPVFAQSQDHQVMVGAGGALAFTPSEVTANPGDTVTFVFNPKNHTVTQSTFAAPCAAMANGINSGYQPVAAGASNVPAMTIKINDTTPLWFYCAQTTPAPHCGKGMVFAVNPTAEKSFAMFQTAANATASATSSNTTSSTGTTGSTGSTGTTGTTGSSGTSSNPAASPSASTTGTGAASGALGMTARTAPLLAALGIAAGLLL